MTNKATDAKVFLSYSHKDRQWVDRLIVHLRALAPEISVWSDASIKPGSDWGEEITRAIKSANVAILLLSADYLASDFIAQEELPVLLNSAMTGETIILPIVVSPFYVSQDNLLAQFQWANPDKPLSALPEFEQDQVFREVVRAIEQHLGAIASKKLTGERREKGVINRPLSRAESVAVSASLADEVARKVVDLLATERPSAAGEKREGELSNKPSESKLVFVIMSFANDMEPIFEGISAAAQSIGLEAKRVKDVPGDYRITEKILEMILSSRLVVADLTHERPNVYFELGYARGLGKSIITIARSETVIHFDVKDWTYIPYIDSRTLERDLKERFAHELER